MKDIFDIKQILLGLPFNITYSLIYIAIFIIILLIYKHYKNFFSIKKEKIKVIKKIDVNINTEYEKLLKEIKRIKEYKFNEINNLKNNNKNEMKFFYSKLNDLIRLFLEDKYEKKISTMTFDEINNLQIDENIKDLLKNIYFKKYAKEINDSPKIREELIREVEKLISLT